LVAFSSRGILWLNFPCCEPISLGNFSILQKFFPPELFLWVDFPFFELSRPLRTKAEERKFVYGDVVEDADDETKGRKK
jgi:hypothetical protein